MAESTPLLRMRGVSKIFPDKYEPRSATIAELFGKITRSIAVSEALNECNFELRVGEIHALTGECGSGKSVLAAILSGMRRADSGELLVDGVPAVFTAPPEAQRLGIVIAPQNPNLALSLTAADNLFMGRELKRGPFINRKLQRQRTGELFARLGFDIPGERKAGELDPGSQQLLSIARALSHERIRALILDEPAAQLNGEQLQRIRALATDMRENEVAVLYISRQLSQIRDIADRVSVMRAGIVLGTYAPDKDIERLIVEAALKLS